MAVKIRLTRIGKKNDPKYRVIVIEEGKKRGGRYIEKIGFYDPIANPHILKIDRSKLQNWVNKGAQMSKAVSKLLKSWKNL